MSQIYDKNSPFNVSPMLHQFFIKKLEELDDLFATRDRWTKDSWARDEAGSIVGIHDKEAVCWCLVGGCIKVFGKSQKRSYYPLVFDMFREVDKSIGSVARFNDKESTTFSDIKRLIRKTKARLK